MNMEHLTNYQNYEMFKYYKKIIKGKRGEVRTQPSSHNQVQVWQTVKIRRSYLKPCQFDCELQDDDHAHSRNTVKSTTTVVVRQTAEHSGGGGSGHADTGSCCCCLVDRLLHRLVERRERERKGEGLKEERNMSMRVRFLLWKEWWEREREK